MFIHVLALMSLVVCAGHCQRRGRYDIVLRLLQSKLWPQMERLISYTSPICILSLICTPNVLTISCLKMLSFAWWVYNCTDCLCGLLRTILIATSQFNFPEMYWNNAICLSFVSLSAWKN